MKYHKFIMGIILIILSSINLQAQNSCLYNLFHNNDCDDRYINRYDRFPLVTHEKWPYDISTGAHIVKYQNLLLSTLNFRLPEHSQDFINEEMTAYLNWCKSYWAAQCTGCSPGIIWEETNQGAEFYWSEDPEDISTYLGLCLTAISPTADNEIVAFSDCGEEVINGISEILLNNTDEFYKRNDRTYYWTTNSGFTPYYYNRAALFQNIFLHEMGHYLGLPHDWSGIMLADYWENGWDWIKNPTINQCDADRFRILYCEECIGNDPIRVEPNTVEDEENSGGFLLSVYPNPVTESCFTINYTLESRGLTSISLFDINGKFIRQIAGEYQQGGPHSYPYPVFDLAGGAYIIVLENNGQRQSLTLNIVK